MICIRKGYVKEVEWLIEAGADVNAQDNDNRTPLHNAVRFGARKIVELLIKNGANVNAQTKQQMTPLHMIGLIGNSDNQYAIAEILLNNGADVNLKNWHDKTPLDLIYNKKSKFMIDFFFQFISLNQLFPFFFVVEQLFESKKTTN